MSQIQIQNKPQTLKLVRDRLITTIDELDKLGDKLIEISFDKYEKIARRTICDSLVYIMSDVRVFTEMAKDVIVGIIENANAINITNNINDIVRAKMLLICAWFIMDTVYGILSRYELSELADIAHGITARLWISATQLNDLITESK